jgi:hypothetical protein
MKAMAKKTQIEKFKQAARQIGTDDNEKREAGQDHQAETSRTAQAAKRGGEDRPRLNLIFFCAW